MRFQIIYVVAVLEYTFPRSLTYKMSDRKNEHQIISNNQTRYAQLIENLRGFAVFILDANGRVVEWNESATRIKGYAAHEIIGQGFEIFFTPEDKADGKPKRLLEEAARYGKTEDEGWRVLKDGSRHWSSSSLIAERDEAGNVRGFMKVVRDISQRRQAEQERDAERRLLSELIDQLPVGVFFFDKTLSCTQANHICAEVLGIEREKLIGMALPEIEARVHVTLPGDSSGGESLLAVLASSVNSHVQPIEYLITTKVGGTRRVVITAMPFTLHEETSRGSIVVINDVTEQHAMQERWRLSQKMEAVGRLAGGIAHDFNNLLAIVLLHSDLLLLRFNTNPEVKRHVEEIKGASESAATLTKQLLAFGRKQMLQPKIININTVVARVQRMLERLIGANIELSTRLDAELGDVRADSVQIEQVLLNLAINARDAMPRGGALLIETKNVELDQTYADRHIAVRAGDFVRLSVSDSGEGMDSETLAQIFEPFYTTKEHGKGTGLGLATVYGIVKQSGGSIWVYSELGKGTTFKIYLPRIVNHAPGEVRMTETESKPITAGDFVNGTETVLLVEDDELVRRAAAEILTLSGYRVMQASTGAEAVALCQNFDEPIDLLLTDVVMPGMSGRELAARVSEMRPRTKVILMSGYTDGAAMLHGVLEEGIEFIEKPFTPASLTGRIRKVLDEKQ